MIYCDNASTTAIDKEAYEAMLPFLKVEYANPSNQYSFSRKAKLAIKEAREVIAEVINATPNEIFFTSGGTEGDNWAIKGLALAQYGIKKKILTSVIEHSAVIESCKWLEALGYNTTYLPINEFGFVDKEKFGNALCPDTIFASIMHGNNEIGCIQDISTLAEIAHQKNVLMHSDAVQTVGHVKVDISKLNVDILTASAHKFNGPKGVGFVYIKHGTPIKPLLSGGHQERNFRAGTENVAGIVGMSVALKSAYSIMNSEYARLNDLVNVFYKRLEESGLDFIINGPRHGRIPGNINISIKGVLGEALLHVLDLKGILVSTGAACTSSEMQVSRIIKSISIPTIYEKGTIRISLGKYNTIKDVYLLTEQIISYVNHLPSYC